MERRQMKLVQQNCFLFRGSSSSTSSSIGISSQDDPGIGRQRSPGLSLGDIVVLRRYCGSLVAVRFPGKQRQIGKQA